MLRLDKKYYIRAAAAGVLAAALAVTAIYTDLSTKEAAAIETEDISTMEVIRNEPRLSIRETKVDTVALSAGDASTGMEALEELNRTLSAQNAEGETEQETAESQEAAAPEEAPADTEAVITEEASETKAAAGTAEETAAPEAEEETVEEAEEATPAVNGVQPYHLTRKNGTIQGPSGKETYYNLPMGGVLRIMATLGYYNEYWVRDDGVKMFGPYVMVAANTYVRPKGTILETSLGTAMVCDHCEAAEYNSSHLDIAVTW